MKILHVVGARPNFMKVAPVMASLGAKEKVSQVLVHTGQHYDINMSDTFFKELGIPQPDVNLGVGSGTHAEQTANVMLKFESVVLAEVPDIVLVYGDVNSTIAAALVCSKIGIKVGHVEAGLRSFDRTMPEEINRVLTDQMADLLFTPSQDGNENLLKEGVASEKIYLVGNVMIDTLVRLLPKAEDRSILKELSLEEKNYIVVTLHRPSNVDDIERLRAIIKTLLVISGSVRVIFPVHPRTKKRIKEMGLDFRSGRGLEMIEPLGYLDFLSLQRYAAVVITDSGGIQEETTFLGVPCLTVRENTERPVTVAIGTNTVVGSDMDLMKREVEKALSGDGKRGGVPPLWDGKASERIANILEKTFG